MHATRLEPAKRLLSILLLGAALPNAGLTAEFPLPQAATWSQTCTTLPEASAYSVAADDGGYIVAGKQWDPADPVSYWAVLVRLTGSGAVADSVTFAAETDRTDAFAVTPVYTTGDVLAGYVATGTRYRAFSEQGHDYYDPWLWLVKTDTNLDMEWQATYGSPFPDRGNDVIQNGTGYLIGGWEGLGTISPSGNGYLVGTDATGNLDWSHTASVADETTGWLSAEVHSVRRTADGGLILATERGIVKTDGGAPPTAAWEYGTDPYRAVQPLTDGYIAVGSAQVTEADETTHRDLLLTRLDASGVEMWSRTFGRATPVLGATGVDDYGTAVLQTSDGGFAVVGTTESYAWHGGSDVWLLKVDSSGALEWDLALGDVGDDFGYGLVEAPSGDLVVAGSVAWEGSRWMWITSIAPDLVPPVPAFTFSPASPVGVEEIVSFDGSASSDPDGSIVDWDWDFGDGATAAGDPANHIFIQPAAHTVTLYVTDDSGIRRSVSHTLTASPLQLQWQRFFGDSRDYGQDLVVAPDGGLVVAGSYCIVTTDCDLWVFKTDNRGRVLWNRTYRDEIAPYNTEGARALTNAPGGGYVLAGFRDTGGDAGAGRDLWLLQVNNTDGGIDWQQHYGGAGTADEGYGVAARPGGGYLVTGYTTTAGEVPQRDLWLLATDGNGSRLWDVALADPGGDQSRGYGVVALSRGGFAITGELIDLNSSSDAPVLTLGGTDGGTETWRTESSAVNRDSLGHWIAQTTDGGFAVAATLDNRISLIKLDAAGTQEWSVTPSSAYGYERAGSGALSPTRGYVLVGHAGWEGNIQDDLLLIRTDDDGSQAWERTFKESPGATEEGIAVRALADGSFIVLAGVYAGERGSTWLMKLGPNTPPTDVTFDVSPPTLQAGSAATFIASGTDVDGTIAFYEWNFGDGGYPVIAATTSQDHVFHRAGTYQVILTAVDDSGGEEIAAATVTVTDGGGADLCPGDPDKTTPGVCGCGVPDIDSDLDLILDCLDGCPLDSSKTEPGVCGCGSAELDTDGDGTLDCLDDCPADPDKTELGECGCGVADIDGDGDLTLDCLETCPDDADKTEPGICGCGVADLDSDADGAADCQETGHDGNGDGVDDSGQAHVCSLPTHDGAGYVTLAGARGTTLRSVDAVANPSPADAPAGAEFGYGFFAFAVHGLAPGDSTTVTLYLPAGAAPTTYYKYGPTPGDPAPHWYEFLYDGATGAEITGNVITLHFVDGERGDDDLDATNGEITDVGGPAQVTAPSGGGGGGGGGCFLRLSRLPRL